MPASCNEGDEVVIAGRGLDRTTDTHMAKGKIVRVYPELDQGRVRRRRRGPA